MIPNLRTIVCPALLLFAAAAWSMAGTTIDDPPEQVEPSAADIMKQIAPKEGEPRPRPPAEPPAQVPPPQPPAARTSQPPPHAAPETDDSARPAKPAGSADDPLAEPKNEPSASEVLDTLRPRDGAMQPIVRPNMPGAARPTTLAPEALPRNAVVPINTRLLPDGYRLVDRPGRLQREGDFWVLAFESRSTKEAEAPLRLLPNRSLEDMEIASAGGTRPVVFIVSGEITEYHGVNYLMIQKILIRPNMGNLR